jgi:hypothetical protein
MTNLTDPWNHLLNPLFQLHPPESAMKSLVVRGGPIAEAVSSVDTLLESPLLAGRAKLESALWLYIDDLDRSHVVSQGIEDATGSYWHGIMHRREGDFSNSHYWFNKVGEHPVIDLIDDYDPHDFIDEVEKRHAAQPHELVALQQREWQALFEWCVCKEEELRQ